VPNEAKDAWDKADVILKPVGGLLTALAVAWIGYSLNLRDARDKRLQFYADMQIKREEADTNLRKEMFNSAIKMFVESAPESPRREVLDLELLAYNFHESIDLGPLFKDVYRRLRFPQGRADASITESERDQYCARLERVAQEIVDRQLTALEAVGKLDADVYLDEVKGGEPKTVIDWTPLPDPKLGSPAPILSFQVTVLSLNPDAKEMRVFLKVRIPPSALPNSAKGRGPGAKEVDIIQSVFRVSFSDFPMIDNTRLPQGYRCAIALRRFDEGTARITLAYFASSRAGLKDKPYYEEMMNEVDQASRH